MIYFTADTHFCHANIIKSCDRPFKDVKEMNQVLINNWNSRVRDCDEIYILGDFLYRGTGNDANGILGRLKGRKYLITGNHDRYLEDSQFWPGAFEWIKDYHIIQHHGIKIVLFHFPMLSWYASHRGSIQLYGHVHNSGIQHPEFGEKLKMLGPRAVNVGVDVHNFSPVSINEIVDRIDGALLPP